MTTEKLKQKRITMVKNAQEKFLADFKQYFPDINPKEVFFHTIHQIITYQTPVNPHQFDVVINRREDFKRGVEYTMGYVSRKYGNEAEKWINQRHTELQEYKGIDYQDFNDILEKE